MRAEFLKLVTARRAAETLDVMAGQGLLLPILCGVAEFGRFARAAAAGQDAVARLAALAVLTAEDAERLRERWRLSNDEHLRLADHARLVARLKDRAEPLDALAIRRLVADEDPHVLAEALAALAGEPRPVLAAGAAAALEGYRSGAEPVPVFPLRGRDFLAAGLRKGREIGERLAFARARWIAEGCPTDEIGAQPPRAGRRADRPDSPLSRGALKFPPWRGPHEPRPISPAATPTAAAVPPARSASPTAGAARPIACPAPRRSRPHGNGSSATRRQPT